MSSLSRIYQHLSIAESVIAGYDGKQPFHLYLKGYFSANKKHGSKDRKAIKRFCYLYFRLGHGVSKPLSFSEKISLAIFLCEYQDDAFLQASDPILSHQISESVESKLQVVEDRFDAHHIFSWTNYLSSQINVNTWNLSFLQQPKLFVRIRPGHSGAVLSKLQASKIYFENIDSSTLAFSPETKLDEILDINKEVVIQDASSQKIGELIQRFRRGNEKSFSIWDCCAASGGKSILAKDILGNIDLTVSDKRKSILSNLHHRFKSSGIHHYHSLVANLADVHFIPDVKKPFDAVIADVPCTGSGTWARTPEWLQYFQENSIAEYAALQRTIVTTAIKHLKPGGQLLYCTCSVFAEENEQNIAYFQNRLGLQLVHAEYFIGAEMQADTLFGALLIKP